MMVLEKAKELGLALCQSAEFNAMLHTQAALDADEVLGATLEEYKEKQTTLVETLQSETGSDRLLIASLSHDVEALQAQLLENPIFNAAMEAQNAFQSLMQDVNREIGLCIGMLPAESEGHEAGCNGSCTGCRGCAH